MFDNTHFYEFLNKHTLWVRWKQGEENGHAAMYIPSGAIIKSSPQESASAKIIQDLLDEYAYLLGISSDHRSVILVDQESPLMLCEKLLSEGRSTVLFAGYFYNPSLEAGDQAEQIATSLRSQGIEVIQSSQTGAMQWLDKSQFCQKVTDIYGSEATPCGISFNFADVNIDVIIQAVKKQFLNGVARVAIKMAGNSGIGNLIIDDDQNLATRLDKFVTHNIETYNTPGVRIEPWIPWESSYSCSFFLRDQEEPFFVALIQQVINLSNAKYLGSRNFLDLDDRDVSAIISLCLPLARLMYDDGIRGFTGMDLIISSPQGIDGEIQLPTGKVLRFIECNPRINGHNQILKALSLIARRDRREPDDFVYWMVQNKQPPNTHGPQEVRSALQSALQGVAAPLTQDAVTQDEVRYLVDTNTGIKPQLTDAVIFFTLRSNKASALLQAAYDRLQSCNLVQS